MTAKEYRQMVCPKCAWTVESPAVEDENMLQHFMLHAEQEHPGIEWSKSGLQAHMRDFYMASKITCPECGWNLTDPGGPDNLIRHMMIHTKEYHSGGEEDPEELKKLIEEVKVENKKK